MGLPQRKSNRLDSENYDQSGAYFITICTKDRKPVLSRICIGTTADKYPQDTYIMLLPYGKIADKYILQMNAYYKDLSIDKYVIMPDHIHLLISIHKAGAHGNRSSAIARFIGTFKRFCNREYGENIWQGRYYDHVIRNQQDYDEIWRYIENNPMSSFLRN